MAGLFVGRYCSAMIAPSLFRAAVAASVVTLACCQPNDASDAAEAKPGAVCAVYESGTWSAWVNAMPGIAPSSGGHTLIVVGEVVMPTPGYKAELTAGPADRSATPIQQLILTLRPPSGPVQQVLSPLSVRYDGPAISQRYRAIRIMCGGQVLTEITDVPVAM